VRKIPPDVAVLGLLMVIFGGDNAPGCGRRGASAPQKAEEGCAEGPVEHGVDDGVDAGGKISQPEEEGGQRCAGRNEGRAHRFQNVEHKERCPAQNKSRKHQSQNCRRLVLRQSENKDARGGNIEFISQDFLQSNANSANFSRVCKRI